MSFRAVAWAVDQKVGDPLAKLVLITLASYANDQRESYPSFVTIANDTEMSRSSVIRKVQLLEAKGFIVIRQERTRSGDFSHNIYTLPAGSVTQTPPVSPVPGGSVTETGGGVTGTPDPVIEPKKENSLSARATLTTLDPDWKPDQALLDWAAIAFPKVNLTDETAAFTDYWLSRGEQRASWPSTWRNWIRRARVGAAVTRHPASGRLTGAALSERNRERMAAYLARYPDSDEELANRNGEG